MTTNPATTVRTSPRRTPARRPAVATTGGDEESAARPEVTRRRPRRIVKHPVTYRLPIVALELIDDAVDAAAARGARLTKEDAVAAAILAHYGGSTNGSVES